MISILRNQNLTANVVKSYEIITNVLSGAREMPTIDEYIIELPIYE